MVDRFNFFLRTNIRFGAGELNKLPAYLKSNKYKKAAFIIDNSLKHKEIIKILIRNCKVVLTKRLVFYYDLSGEPTYEYLDKHSKLFRKHKDLQVLIAIGGGSTMDYAKGVAVLVTNPGPAIKYRGFPKEINGPIPVIAVPSTAGTGSETTYNAVFISEKEKVKLGINTQKNFPVYSVLDPNLIKDTPLSVISSSGMDALTHALESFVCKEANVLTRMLSLEAIKLLVPNLQAVLKGSNSLKVLGNLQLGAYLAIVALFNSNSGPASGLGNPLGTWFGIPHGLAGAFYLPYIHYYNFRKGYYEYGEITDALYGYSNDSKKKKAKVFVDLLFILNRGFKIPRKLRDLKLNSAQIKSLEDNAKKRAESGNFAPNPVEIRVRDILRIFSQLK